MRSSERLRACCHQFSVARLVSQDLSRKQQAHVYPKITSRAGEFFLKELMLILDCTGGIVMTFLKSQTTNGTMMHSRL